MRRFRLNRCWAHILLLFCLAFASVAGLTGSAMAADRNPITRPGVGIGSTGDPDVTGGSSRDPGGIGRNWSSRLQPVAGGAVGDGVRDSSRGMWFLRWIRELTKARLVR